MTAAQFDDLCDDLRAEIQKGAVIPCMWMKGENGEATYTDVSDAFLTMRQIKSRETPSKLAVGEDWDASRTKEMSGWVKYTSVERINRKDTDPNGGKPVSTRWACCTKSDGRLKSRLVARGFEEAGANGIAVESPTAGRTSVRVALSIAAQRKWKTRIGDIPNAFMQARADLLTRQVLLRPPKDHLQSIPEHLRCNEEQLWVARKPVYGLMDAPRLWYRTVADSLTKIGLTRTRHDPCTFTQRGTTNELEGILIVHVDDVVATGTPEFLTKIENHLKKFDLKELPEIGEQGTEYCGVRIRYDGEEYYLDQERYCELIENISFEGRKLDETLNPADITACRGVLGQLAWVSGQSRPDISCHVSEYVGRLSEAPTVRLLKEINRTVEHVKETAKTSRLKISKLTNDPNDRLALLIYGDAAWANMPGLRSQSGVLLALVSERDAIRVQNGENKGDLRQGKPTEIFNCRFSLLDWSSGRIRRVVKSTFAAELMSLGGAVDRATALGGLLSEITSGPNKEKRCLPLYTLCDCQSVVSNIRSLCPSILEKRLRIDCLDLQSDIEEGRLNVRWTPTESQYSDPLTKRMNGSMLNTALSEGIYKIPLYL